MTLSEFFDPYNIEHLKSFKHLEETGTWPNEFFDSMETDVIQDAHWFITIQTKNGSGMA